MTLPSLFQPNSSPVPSYDLPSVPDLDRTHWKGGGGGGWKGGKGNPNAALSALTLLAFLFFLNILQSCLRDTIGQNNGMFMMVLPANATASTRVKREVYSNKTNGSGKEDSLTAQHQNWTDFDITNLVHTQVEYHWSSKENKPRTTSFNSLQTKSKYIENNVNVWDLKTTMKKRISTKLTINKTEDDDLLDISQMSNTKQYKFYSRQ